MRASWKGAINFGMVSIPVKLNVIAADNEVHLHQVHEEDGGRIKFRRYCTSCEEEVPFADVARGFEVAEGQTVVLTDDDMANLPLASTRIIMVEKFVSLSDVPQVFYSGRSYYVEPEAAGKGAYALLRHALNATRQAGVVRITLRQRERLGLLRTAEGVIILDLLNWPDEIREPALPILDELPATVRPSEGRMAVDLVNTLSGKFDPGEYTDEYRSALAELVASKLSGKPTGLRRGPGKPAGPTLADQLRASLAAAREERD